MLQRVLPLALVLLTSHPLLSLAAEEEVALPSRSVASSGAEAQPKAQGGAASGQEFQGVIGQIPEVKTVESPDQAVGSGVSSPAHLIEIPSTKQKAAQPQAAPPAVEEKGEKAEPAPAVALAAPEAEASPVAAPAPAQPAGGDEKEKEKKEEAAQEKAEQAPAAPKAGQAVQAEVAKEKEASDKAEGKGEEKGAGEGKAAEPKSCSDYEYRSLGEKFFKFPVTGSLWTRYRFRTATSGDTDQDFSQNLTMDIGDSKRHFASAHVNGRWTQDLDGRNLGFSADPYTQVIDTYSDATDFRLYSAYVDFNKIPGVDVLRAGRQFIYDTPEIVTFDGARLDTKPFMGKHELKFSFYGGLPVHYEESSSAGDSIVGAYVEGKPVESLRLRFDYTRIDDEVRRDKYETSLQGGDRYLNANLYSLSFWQRWKSPGVRVFGRFTMDDDQPRDGTLRVLYNNAKDRLQVSATYNGWFKEQERQVTEYDVFFDTLKGFEPSHKGILTVSKGWTDNFWLEGGALVRRLAGGGEEGRYNREYDRFHTTFEIRDLPVQNLSFGLTGYLFHGQGQTPDTVESGGDITYGWNKQNKTSVGSTYSIYKFDVFTGVEKDDVRTYYLKHRFRPKKWAVLDLDYEYEISRGEEWHTARLTFRFDF